MAVKKVIEIEVDGSGAISGIDKLNNAVEVTEQSTKSLRTQLREAQLEVATLSEKFGATSKEAVNAAKKAALLKDAIGDAKALTDAFNPDAKFNALSGSLAGVAGGFAAAQGAIGLFGAESEDVEKAILKVNSAMAFSQGLQSLGESIDSFKQLGTVVKSYSIVQRTLTTLQWLWNAAMAANPVGAVVVAVLALVAAGYKLISYFQESTAAANAQNAALKRSTLALEAQKKAAQKSSEQLKDNQDYQLRMAQATGKSSAEIRKIAKNHAEETVALNYKNTMLARATFLRERDTLATLKANDASDEIIKKQEELTKKSFEQFKTQREGLYESYKQQRNVIKDGEIEIAKERTEARNKAEEERKKNNEEAVQKAKENEKKLAEELKKSKEDLLAIEKKNIREIEDLNAKTEKDKLELQLKRELEEINSIKSFGKEKQNIDIQKENARILIKKKYGILEQELDKKLKEEEFKKQQEYNAKLLEEQSNYTSKLIDLKNQELNNDSLSVFQKIELANMMNEIIKNGTFVSEEERTKAAMENARLRMALDQQEYEMKRDWALQGLDVIGQVAQENKAIMMGIFLLQKAVAISDIVRTAASSIAQQKASGAVAYGKAVAASPLTGGLPWTAKIALSTAAGITATKISAGLGIASILAQSFGQIKGMTAGAGGGGSINAAGATNSASVTPTPQFNLVNNAGVNQIATTLAGQQPVKAYVVAKEVTTAQELDRNKITSTKLG